MIQGKQITILAPTPIRVCGEADEFCGDDPRCGWMISVQRNSGYHDACDLFRTKRREPRIMRRAACGTVRRCKACLNAEVTV